MPHPPESSKDKSSCRFYTRPLPLRKLYSFPEPTHSRALSQAQGERPAIHRSERRSMGAPVVRFEIMGGKGNRLEKFYGELFGWTIDSNNPMKYGMVDTDSPS